MKLLDPRKQFEYTLKSEMKVPESDRVSAIIKGLTLSDETQIIDALYSGKGERVVSIAGQQLMAIKVGLVDFKNLKDSEGKKVEIERDEQGLVSDEFLARIPNDIRQEIARVILDSMQPSGYDLKN